MAKKVVLIVIIVLLVLLGVGGYAYLKTDIFKTPEQLFTKYLLNNFEQASNFNLQPYDEIFKQMENESSETRFEMDLNADEENKIDINISLKDDIKNERQALNIEANNNEEYFFGLDTIISKDKLGINVKELHDKYITIENRDLKSLAKKLEVDEEAIEQIPDKIEEIYALSEEGKQKSKELKQKYINKIIEQLVGSEYSVEKNVLIKDNETDIKANKYTLTINEKNLVTILTGTITEILEDPEFLELYKEDIYKDTIEKITELNQDYIDDIELLDESKVIKISIYESDKNTVKTEIVTEMITIELYVNNTETESTITLNINKKKIEDDEDDIGQNIKLTLYNKFENNKGELSITSDVSYNKEDLEIIKANRIEELKEWYDDSYTEEEYEEQAESYMENYQPQSTKIMLKSEQKDKTVTSKLSFSGENTEELNELLNCKFIFTVDSNINVDELNEENSLVINDYSDEEFEALQEEIVQNMINSADEYPTSFIASKAKELEESTSDVEYIETPDEYYYQEDAAPVEESEY